MERQVSGLQHDKASRREAQARTGVGEAAESEVA